MLSNLKSRSIIRLRQKSVFSSISQYCEGFWLYIYIFFKDQNFGSVDKAESEKYNHMKYNKLYNLAQNSIYNSHQENKNSNKLMFWDAVYISWRIVFEHVIVLIPYSIREIVKYKHANTSFSFWEITCHQEAQLNLIKGVKLRLLYLAGSDPSFVIRLH